MGDLFSSLSQKNPVEQLADEAFLFRGGGEAYAADFLGHINIITQQAPFRRMVTPGGRLMGVEITNCGEVGWVSDREKGYRYQSIDPLSGKAWPAMPEIFSAFATKMAARAGFQAYRPSVCLINRYQVGNKLSLHQDKNEGDAFSPVVALSLGMSAVFLFGGHLRTDPVKKYRLYHGDVVVWGGLSRMLYHGISSVEGQGNMTGLSVRYAVTFRHVHL